jgi:hypothetical protein
LVFTLSSSPRQTESCFSASSDFWSLIFPSNQTQHNGKQQDSGGWSNWSNWTIHHQGKCSTGPSHLCSGWPSHSRTHSSKKELIDSFKASGITILEVNRLNPQLFLSSIFFCLVKFSKDRTWYASLEN